MARVVKKEPKPLSPRTALILRVGMVVVVLALAALAAILLIRHLTRDTGTKDTNPYKDQYHLDQDTLTKLFGDADDRAAIANEDIKELAEASANFDLDDETILFGYVYFYYGDDIKSDVSKHIASKASLETIETKAIFFVNLSSEAYAEFDLVSFLSGYGITIDPIKLNRNKQLLLKYSYDIAVEHSFEYTTNEVNALFDTIQAVIEPKETEE